MSVWFAVLATMGAIALGGAACAPYRVQGYTPRLENERPARLRAILAGGQAITLEDPQVVGDSLIGMRDGVRTAIALDQVNQVAVRRDNRIWLLAVGGLLLAAGFYAGLLALVAGSS